MADRTYPSFRDAQHHDSAYDAREYAPPYFDDAHEYDAARYDQRPYDPQDYAPEPPHYAAPQYAQQYAAVPQAAATQQPMFAQRAAPQPRAAQPVLYQMRAPQSPARAAPQTFAQEQFSPDHSFAMPSPMDRAVHWAGALCSVAFVVWAGLWAYDLAVRDVNGIPVVRAAAGPLRIAPQTPGGEVSANQGLAVNAIAALGSAEPLPDEVTLAPQPLDLAAEDISPSTPVLTDLANETPEDMPMSDEAAVEAALAMALSEGGEIAPELTAEAEAVPEPVTMSNTDTAEPVQMEDAVEAAMPVAPPTVEVDPTTIPAGTKMVQLGAFDDDALARAEWANLQTRFADLIGTKALVVQQAKSGGRNFFRLRAHGFDTEDETRRFCAALLAENASCIPVAQR